MPALTEARLLELLRDPRCPVGRLLRAEQPTRFIGLPDLLAFVEQEAGAWAGFEQELDEMMSRLSVERLPLVDLWSAPRRGLRRLRGERNTAQVGYEIPADLAGNSW